MRMKFFIIFAVFALGAQCRSVMFSNVTDTGEEIPINMSNQLKELIASYEENFGKFINLVIKMSKNKENNKQEIQFLNHLISLIEQLLREQTKASSNNPTMKNINNNVNNIEDLINTMKEIDIVYQDGEITDEHIRIKRTAEGYERTASFAAEERMMSMLIDIQHQVVKIQKYLDKLCKNHSISTATLEKNLDDSSSVDQSNKVAIN